MQQLPYPVVTSTNLPGFKLHSRGKVRDIYDIDDDTLLIVTTDRMSAFDVILDQPIPWKGVILNQLTLFWMEKFAHLRRADRPGDGSPAVLQCDRHRVVRKAVHETGRAVDRVDDPAILRRIAGTPRFLANNAVAGVTAADFRADELLDPAVDRRDQIGGAALGMDFRLR